MAPHPERHPGRSASLPGRPRRRNHRTTGATRMTNTLAEHLRAALAADANRPSAADYDTLITRMARFWALPEAERDARYARFLASVGEGRPLDLYADDAAPSPAEAAITGIASEAAEGNEG